MTTRQTKQSSAMHLLKRVYREFVRRNNSKLVVAVLCMVVVAAMTAANAWIMQPVMDEIFVRKNSDLLVVISAAVLAIALIKGVSVYAHNVLLAYIGQRAVTDMQLRMYEHLLHADIAQFGRESSGHMISRFSNDINVIRTNFTNVLMGMARESLTLLFLIGVMFYQSAELALIAFVIFPVAIYPIIRLGKRMRKVSRQKQEELGNFTSQLDDTFQGVRIVKAYGGEGYEVSRAGDVMEGIFALFIKTARIFALSSPILETLAGIIAAAIIMYGGNMVIAGETTPGAFFSFMTAFLMAYRPLKSLSGINAALQEAIAAVKRVYSVFDTKPQIADNPDAIPLEIENAGIEFEDVVFAYDDSGKSALDGVSFKVPAGRRVALVGHSGGGKSTIFNMILRFYDPDSGAVFVDGQDMRNVKLASLRENIAIVTQEATLFDDTVRANIAYGKRNADEKEIIAAAKAAAADEFISELSEGYDTPIGQRGLRLSGGQRQRIAIARAMLRNAPILLLDEATSSLDTVSEQQIQQALDELMKGRTTIVIAHRLSTIINSDLIYVVNKGKIAESGSHKELLKQGGIYKELYDKQFGE